MTAASPVEQEQSVAQALESALLQSSSSPRYEDALRAVAQAFGAVSATLHRADRDARMLHMVAYLGLPEPLVAITSHIPFGKGIAGLCAERIEPVELCNLQTDNSGAARPDAKKTGVAGAISVPVLGADGALVGTLGVGKPEEHTYTADEQRVLDAWARLFGRALAS